MTFKTAWILCRVVAEFFTFEAAWAASGMLKMIFFSRLVLMGVSLATIVILTQAIVSWPRETGEEHLVMQGEFRAAKEHNREVQQDLKDQIRVNSIRINDLQMRQVRSEEFQTRMEEKLDLGMKVLWSMCSLLIAQVIIPLLKLGLRREISRLKDIP